MPKCSGAVATTLSAAPAPLVLLYTKVVWCERVPVTTVVWNLEGGNLAAAVSARERNDDRAISRNRAPATNLQSPKAHLDRPARLAFVETARAAASARGPACLTKIAGRAQRAPRQHARRRPIGAHGELETAVALRESPGHFWQRFALLRIAVQCGEATDEAVDIPQAVRLIREIKNPLRFRQPSPIDVQRIEWPVRIVGCEQNELGLQQPVAVAVRVDYRRQLPPGRGINALGEPNLLVILDLLRQPAERLPLQLDLRPHVEHVDDHRSYARHAGIDGRGEPRCPAALGCAGHREPRDRESPLLPGEPLDGIHRA